MFDLFAVTNRCFFYNQDAYLSQLVKIFSSGVSGIVLREKDIDESCYLDLAQKIIENFRSAADTFPDRRAKLIVHNFPHVAERLKIREIQLPLPKLRLLHENEKKLCESLSIYASVHSLEEALEAEKLGASFLVAGNIFETDCKKGLKGKGTELIKSIRSNISLPVIGLGGIGPSNIWRLKEAGADGAALMSLMMRADNPYDTVCRLKLSLEEEKKTHEI